MSDCSPRLEGPRWIKHPATQGMMLLTIIFVAFCAFTAVGCGDDNDNVDTYGLVVGLESLGGNPDADDVEGAVNDAVDNDRDARRLARAINSAVASGVDLDRVIDEIDGLGDDLDEIREAIRDLKPEPPSISGDDDNDNKVVNSSKEAADLFGGDASSWSHIPSSGGTGWVYLGMPRELNVPSGFRIDYPNNTCESGNGGVYGPAKITTTPATIWYVPGETSCPSQATAGITENSGSSDELLLKIIKLLEQNQGNTIAVQPNTSSGSSTTTGGSTTTTGGTTTSTNGGSSTTSGLVTQTACGPMEWGPAGPAPGHDTDDSGAQVRKAISVMKIPESSRPYVTIHKACPGHDVPNGWIVGSSYTESQGIVVESGFLPAGICIDYDHNVTTITGEVYHTQKFHEQWSRTQINSDGSATGLKFTPYWTPCVFTDGTPSWDGNGKSSDTGSTTSTACPATANEAAAMYGGESSAWTQHPQLSNGWIYASLTAIPGFAVPAGGKVDYDGGSLETGTVPSGSAFTAWCPK